MTDLLNTTPVPVSLFPVEGTIPYDTIPPSGILLQMAEEWTPRPGHRLHSGRMLPICKTSYHKKWSDAELVRALAAHPAVRILVVDEWVGRHFEQHPDEVPKQIHHIWGAYDGMKTYRNAAGHIEGARIFVEYYARHP